MSGSPGCRIPGCRPARDGRASPVAHRVLRRSPRLRTCLMPLLRSTVSRASLCVLAIGLPRSQPRAAAGSCQDRDGPRVRYERVRRGRDRLSRHPVRGAAGGRSPLAPAAARAGLGGRAGRPRPSAPAACSSRRGSRLPWTEEYMTQNAVGEDCLSLNVWTPTRAASGRWPSWCGSTAAASTRDPAPSTSTMARRSRHAAWSSSA